MGTKSNQSQWRETAFRLLGVLAASVLIALNLKSFVQAGDLFPGGFYRADPTDPALRSGILGHYPALCPHQPDVQRGARLCQL